MVCWVSSSLRCVRHARVIARYDCNTNNNYYYYYDYNYCCCENRSRVVMRPLSVAVRGREKEPRTADHPRAGYNNDIVSSAEGDARAVIGTRPTGFSGRPGRISSASIRRPAAERTPPRSQLRLSSVRRGVNGRGENEIHREPIATRTHGRQYSFLDAIMIIFFYSEARANRPPPVDISVPRATAVRDGRLGQDGAAAVDNSVTT